MFCCELVWEVMFLLSYQRADFTMYSIGFKIKRDYDVGCRSISSSVYLEFENIKPKRTLEDFWINQKGHSWE